MARKQRQKRPEKPGYDIDMIRDFIDHLTWEVRIVHAEHTHLRDKIHPELVEQLGKYIEKRNTAGLLPSCVLKTENGDTEDDVARATKILHRILAQTYGQYLQCLENARPCFQTAFQCAKHRDKLVFNTMTPRQVFEMQNEMDGGETAK